MICRVTNYQVGLCRGAKDSPIRTVDLTVECTDDPAFKHIFMRFYERPQDSLGFVNSVKSNVLAFFPIQDFDLTCKLLEGDDDVFFAWIADTDGTLVWTEATTAQTPLRAHHVATGQTLLHLVAPDEQPKTAATQVD